MLDHAPHFDADSAERIALELFGITATATPLTSERDQNFLIRSANGEQVVLKIANALEDRAMIEAQQAAMNHLAAMLDIVPRVIPTLRGETISQVVAADGRRHSVWAVSHLGGRLLASTLRRSPELLQDFGRRIGELTLAFAGFDHPAIHRDFHWDLARARNVIHTHRALIVDATLGAAIDTLIARFDHAAASVAAPLRASAIHNDLNDRNVLVDNDRTVGILDFGDMVFSYTVADLAIAAAYACLESDDPLSVIACVVRGYHAVFPLTDSELAALFGLVTLRLCTSACVAAYQRRESPGNAYLDVSQTAICRTLPQLERIPDTVATAAFRDACGLEPLPASAPVRAWLAAHSVTFSRLLDIDLRTEPSIVLDLGIGGALSSGDPAENTEPPLTRRIHELMRKADVRIAIGRYDEPRLLYMAPAFASAHGPDAERRMIHIGLDLFADAGTPVHAPLDGVIHAFAYNPAPQDYGNVIVLKHAPRNDVEFFTLYGHLSHESISGLHVGQCVAQGERIAWLGAPHENGDWTPHLHLQVMTDDLGLGTDFPGVARASQRAVWRSLCPDPNLLVGVPEVRFPRGIPSTNESIARRHTFIGDNVSIAYRDPVRVVRGWRQYLYDDVGRRYLDAYNNVPHVGHCHPRVVDAACTQMSVLNTNTRYINDSLAEYADRLTATLPPALGVCYFVNSASEANELALRLARTYTKQVDTIVLEAAYHGNTTALIDISPYKHAGPGGSGAPEWVHVAPLPDDYRGPFKRDDPLAYRKYAAQVVDIIEAVRQKGRSVGAFIAETCPSVGGQLILPPGYLGLVYEAVRAAGGICIADEVQTGLGRMGTHFWAFEAHDVTPDIVVMGKPLGNGHPMAAVVTTRAIADAFNNGMEYFSTFGGNNVSCAVGLAVLDVMRDEGLQAHALGVGHQMLAGLRSLANQFDIIGDVRGSGLFLGVELVRDRRTREPAGDEASRVSNRMRELGILLGTDGPYHNVVKIRPPMPFDMANADRLVTSLERVLREMTHERSSR
ncbi:MAG: aminotransferase class-III [Gemmatimonadetes bacterium]|nr:aminotransferase class-III [Gemmatimonadota bacterium]